MIERHYPTSHAEMNLFLRYGTWFGGCAVTAIVSLFAAYLYEVWILLIIAFAALIAVAASAVMTRRLKVRIISETEFEDVDG